MKIINNFFGYLGTVKLPGEKFQASSEQSGRSEDCAVKSVVLNSAEELYTDLRYVSFLYLNI